MPVDPDKREAYLEYLAKEHKDEEVVYNNYGPVIKVPFESPMLTWATTGGVSVGHFGRWYGPEGSGKSLTNLGLIQVAQHLPEYIDAISEIDIKWLERRGATSRLLVAPIKKRAKMIKERFPDGMETCIFDTEQRFDFELAEQIGIDTKRIELIDNNIIEEIIKDASAALEAFHIVIIDSATNGQSYAEANLEPGDYERGTGAKAWSRLKQFRKRFDRNENILIIVDQVRAVGIGKKGNYRGPETAPPNVRFLRHNASLAIEYTAGKDLYLDKNLMLTDDWERASTDIRSLGTDGKEPHGIEMRCKVVKNSTGRPKRSARMRFCFPVADTRTGELVQDIGFDHSFELLEIAQHFEIMEQNKAYWYILDDEFNRTGKAIQGNSKARKAIEEDEELQTRILGRLYADTR